MFIKNPPMFPAVSLLATIAMIYGAVYSSPSYALEVGFEGLLSFEASDNVEGVNAPNEEDGETVGALIGVYGEQRSRLVQAAFSGELDGRQELSNDDSDFETISRFLGAAEFAITPRSWRWYVGDILGGVRNDNAIQTIDDTQIARRNVFVTGPSFDYIVDGVSRTQARLLYVNQTEEDDQIESLYTANFSYQRETTPGSYYGARLDNIYTDMPSADDPAEDDGDFNRLTISAFTNRVSGFLTLYGELGVTQYDTEDESLEGLNAELRASRRLGPRTAAGITLSRTLNDQNLNTIQTLIDSGGDAIGLRPEVEGFFADTRLVIDYSVQSTLTSFNVGAGVAQLDYQLVQGNTIDINEDSEDQSQVFAFASVSRRLSTLLRADFDIRYEQQEYDIRDDETDSLLASARVIYRLSRSFELEGTYVHDAAEGILTRFDTASNTRIPDTVDVTENRFTIGLRWAPPSRASRDLTVQLKSLLQ